METSQAQPDYRRPFLLCGVILPLALYGQRKWGLPYIASALNAQSATAGLQS